MRRRAAVVGSALAIVLAVPTTAQAARGFSYGVSAAEVTSSSAILWAHATSAGRYVVRIARDSRFRHVLATATPSARPTSDNTMQVTVRGLRPGTRFFYRFQGSGSKRSDTGTFQTAPAANANATIRFGWSGDADAQRARGQTQPFYNSLGDHNFAVYGAMARENNNFNLNFGDTIYSDSEVGATFVNGVYQGFAPALTVAQKWAKYRQNLALANLQRLRTSAGIYNHWDDHEFINDFGRFETLVGQNDAGQQLQVPGSQVYGPGVTAFRTYNPVTYTPSNGIYRSFRWGKNLEVFMLDERSFRSAKAGSPTIHTCDNPQSGAPDLAPTAPQEVRSVFARDHAIAGPAGQPGVPERDQRPEPHHARPAPVGEVRVRDQAIHRHVQGDHERGPDPAVLRAALRPLGGLRGRAGQAAHVPQEQRQEHDLPDHGCSRESGQRRALRHLPVPGRPDQLGDPRRHDGPGGDDDVLA